MENKEKTLVSRRSFLTAGGAVAATATAAAMFGCSPSASADAAGSGAAGDTSADSMRLYANGTITEPELAESVVEVDAITSFSDEQDYDVVVVGAGTTGIPAAIVANEAGARVAVLQKEAAPVAQGNLATKVVKGQSTQIGIEQYLHEMHTLNDFRPDLDLLRVYADESEEAIDWYLAKLGEVEFDAFKESDSKDHVYDDGNCYLMGTLFPDSMLTPTTALAEQAEQDGVDFYYETPAVQLIVESDTVVGIIGKTASGDYTRFNASKGVIIAAGDYQNNIAMVERYVADAQPFNRKQANKTGDGHLLGLAAGAVMEPGTHTKMIHQASKSCFREEPFLAVNLNGERFMYEDVPYGARNTILRDQPELCMVSLFDANYSEQVYGWGSDPTVPTVANGSPETIAKYVEDGTLIMADTIEELAEAVGLPVDTTVASVNRYNELCAQGMDLDFGKASKYMQPVNTAPFYAMKREYALSTILAGLMIDTNGQCKNAEGEVIPGLFAAGNCSGPFYCASDYSLSTMGLTLGRNITFGYHTGQYVASL